MTTFELYEQKREQMHAWLVTHYIDEFQLRRFIDEPMLDAGCGEGFWADLFTREGFTVYACDHDEDYIAAGERKYPAVTFNVVDIDQELPYDTGQFGVVFARGLPQMYAYRLTKAKGLLDRLLPLATGLLLVGVYSDGTGEKRDGTDGSVAWHHSDAKYLDLASSVGKVEHSARKGNYLQIGIAP